MFSYINGLRLRIILVFKISGETPYGGGVFEHRFRPQSLKIQSTKPVNALKNYSSTWVIILPEVD